MTYPKKQQTTTGNPTSIYVRNDIKLLLINSSTYVRNDIELRSIVPPIYVPNNIKLKRVKGENPPLRKGSRNAMRDRSQ